MADKTAILSVGIDVGTSTTQVVFSKLQMDNAGGYFSVPRVAIVDKEVVYKSEIYMTPLKTDVLIDTEALRDIVAAEFRKAGYRPEDTDSGAVIITGESARKENSDAVLKSLSDFAGDFVVSAAGPDMESLIAGKGSGAWQYSMDHHCRVVNLDIGGGTTNICVFENGNMVDTACLDIGGRLIRVKDGRVTYMAPKLQWLCGRLEIDLAEGGTAELEKLRRLTAAMAELLAEAVHLAPEAAELSYMQTNHLLADSTPPDIVMFSGGVAACFGEEENLFRYGDIGILLAQAIRKNEVFCRAAVTDARETMRATVIGAGNYSMNISGSTIEYTTKPFPLKNIPVVKLPLEREEEIEKLPENMHRAMLLYREDQEKDRQVALAMKGLKCPAFAQVQRIAELIADQYVRECGMGRHLILVLEEDIGKAIGQALHHRLKEKCSVICIDGISCGSGDFIDLGEPVASGNVIPVIVKTLIFNG